MCLQVQPGDLFVTLWDAIPEEWINEVDSHHSCHSLEPWFILQMLSQVCIPSVVRLHLSPQLLQSGSCVGAGDREWRSSFFGATDR